MMERDVKTLVKIQNSLKNLPARAVLSSYKNKYPMTVLKNCRRTPRASLLP